MTLAHDERMEPVAASASFEVFYSETAQYVFDVVRRSAAGDKHLAHDAVQDAYVIMMGQWGRRSARDSVDNRRYVIGIAFHKLADAYRLRGRFCDFDEIEPAGKTEDDDIEALLSELSLFQAVRNLLAAQPPRRRLVGVLFFIEGFGYTEIAGMLELAPSTVRTHVERLRHQLTNLINGVSRRERGSEPS